MVSYPDSQGAERSLAIRRPPSVASHSSRASTVRRHRPHRSLFGGTSIQPQNEFPVFTHTGDVEIVIANGRKEERYLLHKLILTQCSGFFEAGTSEEWANAGEGGSAQNQNSAVQARIPSSAVALQKKRWRYELDWGQNGDVPMLVQKVGLSLTAQTIFGGDGPPPAQPPPLRNKPPTPSTGFFRTMANFSSVQVTTTQADPDERVFRDYDNMFRIFYNYPPTLDPISIGKAYVGCKSLLHLADMYDALEVVGPRVDHHLLRFQGRLWKEIARFSPSYLKIGYLARSKAIFAEAMVHVVGQWPQDIDQLRNQVPDAVLELIEDKFDEIDELKAKVEGKLFRMTLTTSRGERVTPSNHWLAWLAISLFRQWLAENTTPPPAPILKSPRHPGSRNGETLPPAPPPIFNTGRIFRLLGAGGSAYLGHEECKRFLKTHPGQYYDRETCRKFERSVEELKNKARDIVKPLMRNFLELDLGSQGGGLPYLTCTRIEPQDFPWDE
ncbi:hypothetical protein BDV96DRAFT_658496 [Lophiotrema nucula]|uniref:BTB domain-containing protein n=1 Tax=Lophiotrema nucula TaxID=690887 RepID=A0A6A5ZB34_9PLEO|nr:hypothetical protein BDV96DRAFT_658496 [Lophiotrema nucula]